LGVRVSSTPGKGKWQLNGKGVRSDPGSEGSCMLRVNLGDSGATIRMRELAGVWG